MKLIRIIAEDADGMPRVGVGFDRLGVRPTDPTKPEKKADVAAVLPTDSVCPGEGMSCSAATPVDYLRSRGRPLDRKQKVWEISPDNLPDELRAILDEVEAVPLHVLITPVAAMPLGRFQELLASTRGFWRVVELDVGKGEP